MPRPSLGGLHVEIALLAALLIVTGALLLAGAVLGFSAVVEKAGEWGTALVAAVIALATGRRGGGGD